jgi:LmbE family N-acetylglucosaminyl deacetylase
MKSAIAIVAHPDDIEFLFAGTLLQLGCVGYELHYLCLANGGCGSLTMDAQATAKMRCSEAKKAADILGAKWHEPLCNDLEIIYSVDLIKRLAVTIRETRPEIVLTHSPDDYMVDHTETARLAVTAAFTHGMPNFGTEPPSQALKDHRLAVYHAMPHGLRDGLRRKIVPGAYVDNSDVMEVKRQALEAHLSQGAWLDATQGMGSHVASMDEMSREVGARSGIFEHAEGWRRHLHLGLSPGEFDPLHEALQDKYHVNLDYEASL